MRTATVALIVLAVVGCGEKKPAKIRFLFDVEVSLLNEVDISIGGKKVTIKPPTASVRSTSGYVDFNSSEIKADAKPEIRVRSVCGDQVLTADEMERKPPNESNVVVFTITERLMPKKFTIAIDPKARDVKIGSFESKSPRPDLISMYGACELAISVDGQTTKLPARTGADHSLLVAAAPTSCLTEGVVVYATPGTRCDNEWVERRTGQLAYWGRIVPSFAFESIPTEEGTYQQNACIARGFFGRC